jgi:hypothetical protein
MTVEEIVTQYAKGLIPLGLVILLSTAAIAARQFIEFREGFNEEFGISAVNSAEGPQVFAFTATADIPRSGAYLDERAMRAMGGVLFLAVAKPSNQIGNSCPTLRVDLTQPSGKRLAVRFSSSKEVHGEIFDWELIPTVEYVKSGHDGLFTYMGVRAEYQKAFSENLVGLNLFLLDNSRQWERFPYAHLFLAGPAIEGYPQNQPNDIGLAAWKRLRSFLGSEQLMFFDRNVDFIFSVEGGRLSISGAPYWAAVEENDDDYNGHVVREFKDTAKARLTNPTVYDSVYRVSKYSAFFRYVAQNCASEWSKFRADLDVNREAMTEIVVPPRKMWDRVRP